MKRFFTFTLPLTLLGAMLLYYVTQQITHSEETMEDKKLAALPVVPEGHKIATFAAGCYWCVEAIFQRVDGVSCVTSGFIGGHIANPEYEAVCAGVTGHTEAVQIVFDPQKVSYEKLLNWFWKLHDPTQLNRQGNDVGTQYRSGIFYHNEAQKKAAVTSLNQIQENFTQPIVTEITQASIFYPAKVSHQDYYSINGKKDPYCRALITPKLKKLKLDK